MKFPYTFKFCRLVYPVILMMLVLPLHAQLYQQQFNTNVATVTNGPVTDANYVSATPNNSQLTYLATGSSGTNTMTVSGGNLQIVTSGTSSVWAAARNANFAGPPTSIKITFDANIDILSSGSNPKFFFYVGSNFTNGTAAEANANVHSGFSVRYANSSYYYVKTLANAGTESAATQITDGTSLTFTYVANNSGGTLSYTAPDGSTATVADDTWDLWVGTTLRFDDQAATTTTQNLNQFKFGDFVTSSAGRANWILDNITVTTLAPSSPTITTSVSSLSGFSQAGATPSSGKSYTVSGNALTAASVDVTAPAGFQVSLDSSSWVSSFSLPVSGGNITGQPKKVYARMNNAAAGAHSGDIMHVSTGATTVNVNVSGNTIVNPTIVVNPTSLAFGTVVLGSSSEMSYTVEGYLLNPASGTVNIVPPSFNYLVSLTPGTGYQPTLSLPYTGGSLPTTTIYVSFVPSAVATYNGNIVNSANGSLPAASVAVTGMGSLQQNGDYGSVTTGLWSATSTWKLWDGTGFNTTATTAPMASDNVFINPADSVTVDASSKVCNNLYVYGKLASSSKVNSPYYINISGTVLNVNTGGAMGKVATGDQADGLSLHILNSNFLITGTGGTIYLSRIRTNAAGTQFVINHDLTLNYHGATNQGGHTAAFYPNAGDNLTVTINAGKTVTLAPWACFTTTSSSNASGAYSMALNVNGALNLNNQPVPNDSVQTGPNSMIYGGVSSTHTFSINVGSGGVINTPQFYPNGTTSTGAAGTGQDAAITVASGGAFNVSNLADFRKPSQIVTGAGQFSMQAGSRIRIGSPDGITTTAAAGPVQTTGRGYPESGAYAYEGLAAQVTGNGLPNVFSNFTINNPAGVTLSNTILPFDSVTLAGGVVTTGAFKLIVNQYSKMQRTAGHVNGFLQKYVKTGNTVVDFEVGDAVNYSPVMVSFNNVITAGDLAGKATAGDHPQLSSSNIDGTKSVNRYFTLTNSGITFTNYSAIFNFLSTDLDAGANPSTFIIGDYKGATWTYPVPGTRTPTSTQSTGNTSFSDFAIGNSLAVVPISDLLEFAAVKVQDKGLLSWKVNAQHAILTFEVMRSTDGRNFSGLALVNAVAALERYQFTDAAMAGGTNYYRLKVRDKSGQIYYSPTVALLNKSTGIELLSITPNLFSGESTTLNFVAAKAGTVQLTGTDMRGKDHFP